MTEIQLNIFDTTVITIMVFSCLFAFFRGFVREMLSLLAWIGAGIIMMYYFADAAKAMEPYFKSPIYAALVSTVGLYLVALMGLSLINAIILRFIKRSQEIAAVDSTLGLLFGAFRGSFIISLAYLLMTIVLPEDEYPEWIETAQTRPYVEKGAVFLANSAPEYIEQIDVLQKKIEARYDRSNENAEPVDEQSISSYRRRFLSDDNGANDSENQNSVDSQ